MEAETVPVMYDRVVELLGKMGCPPHLYGTGVGAGLDIMDGEGNGGCVGGGVPASAAYDILGDGGEVAPVGIGNSAAVPTQPIPSRRQTPGGCFARLAKFAFPELVAWLQFKYEGGGQLGVGSDAVRRWLLLMGHPDGQQILQVGSRLANPPPPFFPTHVRIIV